MLQKNDTQIGNKIRELSNAMYKQLGSSPSINPYSQNYNDGGQSDQVQDTPSNIANSNLETRAKASSRTHVSTARSHSSAMAIQDEPLELTVQKSVVSDKSKHTKKQPKTAPILQQKKLQTKKQTAKNVSPSATKKNSKGKSSTKTKNLMKNLKKQKEKVSVSHDVMDSRRPRRGAAIAASAAMMAQKVLDKQLSSANVAFSDESSSDDDGGVVDDNEDRSANTTLESEGMHIL